MTGELHYQIAVHTGEDRLFHPEDTFRAALDYAMRVGPQADFVAVEQWDDNLNGLRGGWRMIEILRDRVGYMATVARRMTTLAA